MVSTLCPPGHPSNITALTKTQRPGLAAQAKEIQPWDLALELLAVLANTEIGVVTPCPEIGGWQLEWRPRPSGWGVG